MSPLRIANIFNSMIGFAKPEPVIHAKYGVPYQFDLVLVKKSHVKDEVVSREIADHLRILGKAFGSNPVIIFSDTFETDVTRFLLETPCYIRLEEGIVFPNMTYRDVERINPEIFKKLNKL